MNKLKDIIWQAKVALAVGIIVVLAITSFTYSVSDQTGVKGNGLSVMLIDVNMSGGSISDYKREIIKVLDFKNIGITRLYSSTIDSYVSTIENYDASKYLYAQILSEGIDLIILPERYIKPLAEKNILSPLPQELTEKIAASEIENCSLNGTIVAFPLLDTPATKGDNILFDLSFNPVYAAVITDADQADKALEYLKYVSSRQKPVQ